jgi:hypothetical protein
MESIDFVYDLTAKMQEQNIDYFLVTVRDNKADDVVDIFYHVNSDSTYRLLKKVLDQGASEINGVLKECESLEPTLSEPIEMPRIFDSGPEGSSGLCDENEFKERE